MEEGSGSGELGSNLDRTPPIDSPTANNPMGRNLMINRDNWKSNKASRPFKKFHKGNITAKNERLRMAKTVKGELQEEKQNPPEIPQTESQP